MKLSRRWIAAGLGVIAAWVLVEVALRLTGAAYDRNYGISESRPAPVAGQDVFTILCLGNSQTLGTGAPPGESFPDHLQRILDKEQPHRRFRVVNGGRGFVNSAYILEHLQENLDRIRPRLVAIMTGEPNFWNMYRYDDYLRREGRVQPGLGDRLYQAFYGLRTFRLATLLIHQTANFALRGSDESLVFSGQSKRDFQALAFRWISGQENRLVYDPSHLSPEQAREGIETLERYLSEEPENQNAYLALARLYHEAVKDLPRALVAYRQIFRFKPGVFSFDAYNDLRVIREYVSGTDNPALRSELESLWEIASRNYPGDRLYQQLKEWYTNSTLPEDPLEKRKILEVSLNARPIHAKTYLHLALDDLKQGKFLDGARIAMRGLEQNPFSIETNLNFVFSLLLKQSPDPALHREIQEFVSGFRKKYPNHAYRTEYISEEEWVDWVRSDLQEMIRILEKNQVPFVLQNYIPRRVTGRPMKIDDMIRDLAREGDYPLADNSAEFLERFRKAGSREPFYTGMYGPSDDHPNSDGYRIIAERLYRTMTEARLLDEASRKTR